MRRLCLQALLVGALCAFVFIFAGDPVAHLLHGAGIRELAPVMPVFGVLLPLRYLTATHGVTLSATGYQGARVVAILVALAAVLLAVTAGLSPSHLGAS